MEIKPGKWKMRNGECAVVEFISAANSMYVAIGYIEASRSILTWTRDGKEWAHSDSPKDLIEPWTNKPVVNWAAMPAWAKWVAMDEDGHWWWFDKKPRELSTWWEEDGGYCGRIPVSHVPSFTGDWRDSLVERPAQVGTI